MEPHYRPDPDTFPPSFLKMTDRVRASLAAQPLVTLTIQSRPADLQVFVGGRPAGSSPLRVVLPHGAYRVEPLFGQRRGLPLQMRLESDATLTIDEAFEGIVWPNAGPCLATTTERSGRLDAMARIGAVLEVELVIGVREERLAGEERYLVASAVDVGSGQELREGRIKYGLARPSTEAIQRLAEFISTGTLHPPVEATREDARSRRTGVGRWASYALGGVGAVLLGGGGAMHLRAGETGRQADALFVRGVLPEAQRTRFQELQSRSERERRIAWGLTAGGAVVVGGAATVFLLTRDTDAPPTVTPVLGPGSVGLSGRF